VARVAVTGPTLRPAISPGTRSSTTAYSCARLTLTACDIDGAREMGVAAVMDCLVWEVSQVKVGDHHPGLFGSAVGLRVSAWLHVTRVRHVVVAVLTDVAQLHNHV
jgi:hypothetical protein